jgi:iron complex outermembrane receptor protein
MHNGTTSHATLAALRGLLMASVCGAAFASLPAAAATDAASAAQPAAAQLQEIVVTAQKRQESANSVPMSITAATGEVLERQGIKQPRDLVKITPSFTYTDSYVGSPIYTLRGVGFSDISLGGRPTVSIYVDEAPLPFSIETRGASLDLERVEVLKGPQGTLFGQNATGGAINYIAAKPTRTFEAGAHASYGNFNAFEVGGFISGPITDTLRFRLAANHSGNDAWQKSYTTGATNGVGDFTNARLLLEWTPTDRLKFQLNVNGNTDRGDVQASQLIHTFPDVPPAAPFVPELLSYPLAPANARAADWNPQDNYRKHNDFLQVNGRIDYTLGGNLLLTSITSYSRYHEQQLQDIDGTALSDLNQLTRGKIVSLSEEVRVAGDIGHSGHFVVGVNYAHDKVFQSDVDDISGSTIAYLFYPLPLFTTYRDSDNQNATTTAVFANVDYKLLPTVKVYGGLRYTRVLDKFNGCTADINGVAGLDFGFLFNAFRSAEGLAPNPPIATGGCVTGDNTHPLPDGRLTFTPGLVQNSLNEDNVSWRAGVEWTPTERTLLYANVSEGYKAGGFPDLAASVSSQFLPAVQESVVAYEVGFKSTLLERTLQLNGAVFYYDYSNKQILGKVLDPVFGPLLRLINVPKSDIVGAELQLAWTPVRGLTITGGGSYIDSSIRDHFTNYDPDGVLTDFNGEAFPNTPKWQFVSDVDYRWDLTQKLRGFAGVSVTYQDKTNSQLGGFALLTTKAYTLVDLRAGVETRDGAWRLTVWGRNVGDVYYWTSANRDLDTDTRFAGMPATYGVTIDFRYR